jgi:hypothetical protein
VTFLSDYGLEDEFVGVCRGVIKRIAPDVEILDISHGVAPQDVRAGATVLSQAVGYMPEAVHLAIVDPGVGTKRRALVVETHSGSPLVGPDNGLLWQAAEELGGTARAFSIQNEELFLTSPSKTFQGRDIFAPVAAHLALGIGPEKVGTELSLDDLVRLELPLARVDDDHVHARVVQIDHFGNLQLNAARQELEGIGVLLGDRIQVRVNGRAFVVPFGQAFSEVATGRLLVLEDSHRWLTLAVNQGDARAHLEARRGDPVILARIQVDADGRTG